MAQRRAALAARYPTWQPATLDTILSDAAARHPDRPMVLTDDATLTYRDVAARADVLARGLRGEGVRAGDRVALVMANHADFVPLVFAIWHLGAAAIPVNFLFKARELAYVVGQSECRVVITMASFRGLDYLAAFDEVAPGWRTGAQTAFPHLRSIIVHGGDNASPRSLEALQARGTTDTVPLAANPTGALDPAVVMYTSGTTGLPKGVIQTHDNLARSAYAGAYHQAFEDGRRTLFSLPLYHAFALVEGLLAAMFVGGAIIPQLIFDATATLAGIERHRATYLMAVPTMSVALVEHPDIARFDLSSLQAVLSAAAPTPVRIWQQLKDRLGIQEVFTGYGMTEVGAATTLTAPNDDLSIVAQTVGRLMDAGAAGMAEHGGILAEYKTVDPLTGEDLPPGSVGELCSRGPTSTSGYFAKPAETAALFLPGGWLRSGDLGRVRPDGYIELTGRSKELYKSGGELVSPKEVEELLSSHPAVAQTYAVGVPDDRWGEMGCAWIVLSPGASVSAEELIELARQRLARFKVPKHVLFLDAAELPTTATGKVQKFRLVDMARQRLQLA
ncbi:class I adenylate-forming enzyme family protein [Reyranella sp. CPCC 100927]|uniref:class I adenylate-forming enzyme family protein n=1 Tax=Reyranella sp. CPCC 100927 TaxID=2599616 RepID=UPI001C498BEE|nr:class I adenylate-forming enzyme family protein [Reyranella sp. CPCC 100927]